MWMECAAVLLPRFKKPRSLVFVYAGIYDNLARRWRGVHHIALDTAEDRARRDRMIQHDLPRNRHFGDRPFYDATLDHDPAFDRSFDHVSLRQGPFDDDTAFDRLLDDVTLDHHRCDRASVGSTVAVIKIGRFC